MPGGTTYCGGNIKLQQINGLTISTPTVTANTSTTANFSLPGVQVFDVVDVQSQSHVAGLSIGSSWCGTNGTITVQFINSTGSTIAAQTNYQILVLVSRFENANLGFSYIPTAIV
jgi:hypothetical protein